jgi:hypothetical protein
VQQELVRLDKKGEVILSDGRFVTIHKLKLGHLYLSKDDNEMAQAIKLISFTTKIDDKPPSLEEVLNLDVEDFNKIMVALSK